MTRTHASIGELLSSLNLGSSVAEHDQLLTEARIETPTFEELTGDRIDLVRGTKGSGKTALFRIFTDLLRNVMLEHSRVFLVPGIESVRDPVFMRHRGQLESLDEISFENFWRTYFICVINNHVFFNEQFPDSPLSSARSELKAYRGCCTKHGYPTPKGFTPQTMIRWVLDAIPKPRIKSVKFGLGIDPTSASPQGTLEIERSEDAPAREQVDPGNRVPVFIQEVHDKLLCVLEKADLSIWVMMDRLDEIFPRRSDVERVALRALLRTVTSFSSQRLRVKVFLRDDVLESVTETPTGFVNLTHVLTRASSTLKWSREQLLHLLVRRFFSNQSVTSHYSVNLKRLDQDAAYREEVFYRVFPDKIHAGKNQSRTMEWLMKHCEDGNGVVTPRDLIELITFAVREQREILRRGGPEPTTLLTAASIRAGYAAMCEQKRISYLKAEFPHFWGDIERFEGRKAEHSEVSLRRVLGEDWKEKAKNLAAIGFLRFNARSRTYLVPYLYRQSLGIRQGRET